MQHENIDNIYNQIMLLSDTDKKRLYQRMQNELHGNQTIVAYTTAGQPLTEKQYVTKIEKAIEQADRGELITDEELQKEIEAW
jgi:predicted transcriptional regulator